MTQHPSIPLQHLGKMELGSCLVPRMFEVESVVVKEQ
jgi:hypothetical protein